MPGCPQIRFPFDSIFANENSILAFIDHVHIITRMSPGSTDTIPILHLHRVSYWLWQIESAAGHRSGWRWNSNNNMEASFVLYKQSRITKHSRRFSAFSKKDRRGRRRAGILERRKCGPGQIGILLSLSWEEIFPHIAGFFLTLPHELWKNM